jgi:redox-regulated HSP33 family molecular chaperone
VLLGSTLKDIGRSTLQTQTDGVVDMIVVDIAAPDRVRAYARFDAARLAEIPANGTADSGVLLGHGHLAMTIAGRLFSPAPGLLPDQTHHHTTRRIRRHPACSPV